MIKKGLTIVLLLMLFILAACETPNTDTDIEDEEIIPKTIKQVSGLEDITITQNEYFSPLKDVVVLNEKDENIHYLFEVTGHVNYGKVGTYELTYDLVYDTDVISETRVVTVEAGTIQRTTKVRNELRTSSVNLQQGSYRSATAPEIDHPVQPQNINQDLLHKAVPSNGWWTSLLAQNYGGGNGIYTNPLRASFTNSGAEITNPGAGFVQYWNPSGFNTMANFSLVLPDLYVKTSTLNAGYQTTVVDYSQTGVSVAMRNVGQPQDHMVLTYTQGSPYVFAEVMDQSSPYINVESHGAQGIEFYNLDGVRVTNTHTGEGLIIKLVNKHIGYETSRPANVGAAIYGDRYFLVSTMPNSTFTITDNRVNLNIEDNFFAVSAIQNLSEAQYYQDHAFVKTMHGEVTYVVDYETSIVHTTYHNAVQYIKGEKAASIQFLLPHHYVNSDVVVTNYEFETVRGILKLMEGHTFTTQLSFYGLLPAMTKPTNSEFSTTAMNSYLADLSTRTEITDTENFLNDEGPYWNSKALYPLA